MKKVPKIRSVKPSNEVTTENEARASNEGELRSSNRSMNEKAWRAS